MRKTLIISLAALLFGCHKSNNSSPSQNFASQAGLVGLQVDAPYIIQSVSGPLEIGTIIFHSNQTITEYHFSDTITYPAVFVFSNNYSKSILNNGFALRVVINDTTQYANPHVFLNAARYFNHHDTTIIGTFLTGDIVLGSAPTLGCQFPISFSTVKGATLIR